MDKRKYENVTNLILKNPNRLKIFNIINSVSTIIVYLIYPIFLLVLILKQDERLWKVLFIPSISFILVSLFRKHFNAPRPYEVLNIQPIIHKDTKGKSFPSRHVFSAFIIAMTLYYISIPIGVFLMFIGTIIATLRVVGGVHFPKDVIAGAIVGISCAIIGWNIFFFI